MLNNIIYEIKKNKWNIMWWLILLVLLMPFVITIFYSIPAADDFSMANNVVHSEENLLLNSIKMTYNFYMTWGGDWPYNFLEYLINPIVLFSVNSHAIGIELMFFFLLLFFLLYFFIKEIFKFFIGSTVGNIYKWFFLALVGAILNTNLYPEIYYWFVGNSYLWQVLAILSVQLYTIKFFQNVDNANYKKDIFCLSVVGFMACSAYQLAVSLGIFYLLVGYKQIKRGGTFVKSSIVPLMSMVIGGCVSCFAPGNFVRHEHWDTSGVHVWDALIFAFRNTIHYFFKLMRLPVVFVIIIIIIYLGYILAKVNTVSLGNPILILGFEFISVMGVCFPLALGYSSAGVPNRMEFLIVYMHLIWGAFAAISFGMYLYNNRLPAGKIFDNQLVLAAMCFVLLYTSLVVKYDGKRNFDELPWVATFSNIKGCREESVYWKSMLSEISYSDDKDVIIYVKKTNVPQKTGILFSDGISEDSSYWVNKAVAAYMGKNSITLVIEK